MINREDKKDVKNALGKAIANKVGAATKDKKTYLDKKYDIQDKAIMAEHKAKNRVPSGVNYKAHGRGLNGPKN